MEEIQEDQQGENKGNGQEIVVREVGHNEEREKRAAKKKEEGDRQEAQQLRLLGMKNKKRRLLEKIKRLKSRRKSNYN